MLFDRDDAAGRPTKQKANDTSHRNSRARYLITPTDRHFSYYTHRMHTTWIVFCLSLFPPTFDFLAAFVATTSGLTLHIHTLTALLPVGKLQFVPRRTVNC